MPRLIETSNMLFAALLYRLVAVILVIFTLAIRPTLPFWMIEWFRLASYPLLIYSLVSLILYKKAAAFLRKYPYVLFIDLAISIGIIQIGGSWRSSYFGYTITSIILFTIFKGRIGAYISTCALTVAAIIKDPSGGLPSLEVFFVDNWDMRMGAALMYITTGLVLGYFSALLQKLELLAKEKVAETNKLTAMEERNRLVLELHDGAKQMVTAMLLKMHPSVKKLSLLQPDIADELRWQWRGMNYLHSELNQVMETLRGNNSECKATFNIAALAEEEAKIVEVMTGFSWKIFADPKSLEIPLYSKIPMRRFFSEAFMNSWKHAGVSTGITEIKSSEGSIAISIFDNGKGFNYMKNEPINTTGLKSLQYRTKELDGELLIETAPDKGCRLILTIPVR